MDLHVWLTLLLISFISGIVIIIKMTTVKVNKVVDIIVLDETMSSKNSLYTDENITFITHAKGKVTWDFGDRLLEGDRVVRKYIDYGKKAVTLILNGKAVKTDTIVINRNIPVGVEESDINPIYGPETPRAQERARYTYNGKKKVSSFVWTVLNHPEYPLQTSNKASFTFITAFNGTIELELDNDRSKTYTKQIVVLPAHVDNPRPIRPHHLGGFRDGGGEPRPNVDTARKNPVAVTPPSVQHSAENTAPESKSASPDDFKYWFQEVIDRRKTTQDFNPYLCSRGSTPVIVVDQDKPETVDSFCELLAKDKKNKIEWVQVTWDFKNCVARLKVKVKFHKKFLGILN